MNPVLFQSKTDLWSTPQSLFNELNEVYHFTLDVCALPCNAKCSKYFTPNDDGLMQSWSNHIVWCNPPYGYAIRHWVKKAYDESMNHTKIVMLLPARTDTMWFHDYILDKAEITFIRGRLTFGDASYPAPFPSMLVFYNLSRYIPHR